MSNSWSNDDIIQQTKKATHVFKGDLDENGLRTNRGEEAWYGDLFQKYTGQFLNNNLHSSGVYFILQEGNKIFYDGLFYANSLEGYCQIFYSDGANFQGLFRNNSRFGPGVLSLTDGTQNIGLWSGFTLRRLAACVSADLVPKLARTYEGKVRLLSHKQLVPVCPNNHDVAKEVLKNLQANERVLEQSDLLYNVDVRNKESLFFNNPKYDKAFFCKCDCTIETVVSKNELGDVVETTEDTCIQSKLRMQELQKHIEKFTNKLNQTICLKKYVEYQMYLCKTCCAVGEFAEPTQHVNQLTTEDLDAVCFCKEMTIGATGGLQNKLETLNKEEAFYNSVISGLQLKLNIEANKNNDAPKKNIKKIQITDLLSWNNEEIFIDMLRHSFLHRKSESFVTFNIARLLAGDLQNFGATGIYEQNCRQFLRLCSKGATADIKELLLRNHIDLNLCDAQGNTGLMIAASKDNVEVMSLLIDSGAKVDIVNDEGLTPMNLCILRYLAVKHNVTNWETAFLDDIILESEEDLKEVTQQWYPHESLLTLSSVSFKESFIEIQSNTSNKSFPFESITRSFADGANYQLAEVYKKLLTFTLCNTDPVKSELKYIFDVDEITPTKPTFKAQSSDHIASSVDSFFVDKESTLARIHGSILVLIVYGADSNICEVPLPTLILSVFTENAALVAEIIDVNADPNVIWKNNMNCLHIIACLRPCLENVKILNVLLHKGCDPNVKTIDTHWSDRKREIMGKGFEDVEYEDTGKNPLHLICLRKYFENDVCNCLGMMAKDLLQSRLNPNDLYLGHNALSLAILAGNVNLMKSILETKKINPHKLLGYNMGNCVTVLCLKRYIDVLPLTTAMEVLKALLESGGNPLVPINNFENSIDFVENEYKKEIVVKTKKKEKNAKDSQDDKRGSSKSQKKIGKAAGKKTKQAQNKLCEYLKELTRHMIIKRIQRKCVEILYIILEDASVNVKKVLPLVSFLNQNETFLILCDLFETGEIDQDRLDYEVCDQLFNLVEAHEIVPRKGKKSQKKQNKKPNKRSNKAAIPEEQPRKSKRESLPINYKEILRNTDLKFPKKTYEFKRHESFLPKPTSKYEVCFHCLKKRDKVLFRCPKCDLISFCSESCNAANLKLNTQHHCGILFSAVEEKPAEDSVLSKSESICELMEAAKASCIKRLNKKHVLKLEQQRKQLEIEKKADIYGTRSLKKPKHVSVKDLKDSASVIRIISHNSLEVREKFYNRRSEDLARLPTSVQFLAEIQKEPVKQQKAALMPKRVYSVHDDVKKMLCECAKEVSKPKVNISGEIKHKLVVKKLKKIPRKYQFFMKLLHQFFPDTDFSSLFLPYACYTEGQLYYRFLDYGSFAQTYSMT